MACGSGGMGMDKKKERRIINTEKAMDCPHNGMRMEVNGSSIIIRTVKDMVYRQYGRKLENCHFGSIIKKTSKSKKALEHDDRHFSKIVCQPDKSCDTEGGSSLLCTAH